MSKYSEIDLERQVTESKRLGRTVPLRTFIKPQVKALLLACAEHEQETMTRIIEQAIRDYARQLGVTADRETN